MHSPYALPHSLQRRYPTTQAFSTQDARLPGGHTCGTLHPLHLPFKHARSPPHPSTVQDWVSPSLQEEVAAGVSVGNTGGGVGRKNRK